MALGHCRRPAPYWTPSPHTSHAGECTALPNPVAFATGGGSQSGKESLTFSGSKILDGEEVYVLEECPPAQSIGKAVIDKGYMFIWDPRESVPYLIAPGNINRCKLKVPKNAKICASRVVEYVPQYDEELTPCSFEPRERLAPIPNAMPASSVGPKTLVELDDPNNPGNSSIPTDNVFPPAKDVETDLAPESVGDAAGLASASGCQKVAVENPSAPNSPVHLGAGYPLGNGEPPKDKILKQQATNPKHMRLSSSNSQFYPISHITKDNTMKFSHSDDGKADGFVDSSEQHQLSTSSVVLDKGSQKGEVLTGKVESHRSESVAVNMHNPEPSVLEGDLVFPVGMLCGHALFRGGTPHDLKSPNNTEDDVLCHIDGGNNDPSTPDLRRCPMNTLLDHILIVEDTPGCANCNTHTRHPADQRCAHFADINTVEEKKRHKKGKKVPSNASTRRVKSDEDAEPYARIRVGEELYNPVPSHVSLDSDEHHRIMHEGGPKLELPNPDVPLPSSASVPNALIQSQVVSSASIPCQESLPGSNQPTGRTNRRHWKVAKNACNANAKPITHKFACSPDIRRLSVSKHNGIPSDGLSRDNIELGMSRSTDCWAIT